MYYEDFTRMTAGLRLRSALRPLALLDGRDMLQLLDVLDAMARELLICAPVSPEIAAAELRPRQAGAGGEP